MSNSFIIDSFNWSFSRINSYAQCPKAFYLQYIKDLSKTQNAFSEWGSFCHKILEKYYKGELDFYELSQVYKSEYSQNITLSFPPNKYVNLNENYYNSGKEYFDNFDGKYSDCEIVGVEKEIDIQIGKYRFIGYIDLILKDKNGFIIVDHKSKKKFKTKKEKEEYLRQLYLYSIYIHKTYGEYPNKLIFNMFRANNEEEESFNIKKIEEAKKWAIDTIEKIYKDIDFKAKPDQFFCNHLCSVKEHCACSDRYIGE